MFFKTGVFKGFAKFTGKRLCQSLFFNKVAGPKASFKKRLWSRCFLVSFVKYLRTLFKQNTSGVEKKNNKEAELNQLIFISVTNTFAIHFTQYNTQNLLSWSLFNPTTAWIVSKYGVFVWSVFSCIRTEYGETRVSLYIQSKCGKIQTRKISIFGHFSRSELFWYSV